jgi:mRNA interferase MazF
VTPTRVPASGNPIPLRGEVWDVFFPPPLGDHPVVVLTSNALISRLGAVTVAIVTGTEGPAVTHVPLDADAGVTKYPVSWANATDLHTVPRSRLRRRRGLVSARELERIEGCLRAVLVL